MTTPPDGTTRCDLLVVGGGPAGAAAAITAARLGLRACLVEAAQRPREAPGETVHPGIETVLDYLGVLDDFRRLHFERYRAIVVEHAAVAMVRAVGEDALGPWEGWQLRRSTFDDLLRRRAADVGVEVLLGARALEPLYEKGRLCGATLDRGVRKAGVLVDASGHHGWLARRLPLRTRTYSETLFAGFGHVRDGAKAEATPTFRAHRRGWTWQAHVRPGVRAWVRLARTPRAARRVPGCLAGHPVVAPPAAREVTWRLATPAAGRGYVVAGDAAARLDPASGQGILRALVAGVQAARTAERVLGSASGEEALVCWDRWVTDTFEEEAAQLAHAYHRLGIELDVGPR